MSEPFDPQAYAAAMGTADQPFDPAAYITASGGTPVPAQPEGVGAAETFVNSGANALPFGRQVTDALSAALLHILRPSSGVAFTPEMTKAAAEMGRPVQAEPTLAEDYRSMRDYRGNRTAEGEEANPWTGRAGKVAGTALGILAPLPGVKIGSGLKGALASGAVNGALYGGAGGFTGSDELAKSDIPGAIEKGIEGGVVGAGIGAPLGAAGQVAATKGVDALRALALASGRKVLTNGARQLSTKEALSPEATQAALDTAIRPFRTAEGVYEALEEKLGEKGEEYRGLVSQLQKHGVSGPNARDLATQLLARGAQRWPHETNEAIPNLYLEKALQAESKAPMAPAAPNLQLDQALNLTRGLQNEAKYGRFEETPLNEAKRDVASIYRQAVEDRIASEASKPGASDEVKRLAAQFVPLKREVGNLAEAEAAARAGASRGAHRGHVGPTELAVAAGELAHGSPGAALGMAGGLRLLRERLPSTTAWSLNALRSLAQRGPSGAPGSAGFLAPGTLDRLRGVGKRGVPAIVAEQSIDLGDLGTE